MVRLFPAARTTRRCAARTLKSLSRLSRVQSTSPVAKRVRTSEDRVLADISDSQLLEIRGQVSWLQRLQLARGNAYGPPSSSLQPLLTDALDIIKLCQRLESEDADRRAREQRRPTARTERLRWSRSYAQAIQDVCNFVEGLVSWLDACFQILALRISDEVRHGCSMNAPSEPRSERHTSLERCWDAHLIVGDSSIIHGSCTWRAADERGRKRLSVLNTVQQRRWY